MEPVKNARARGKIGLGARLQIVREGKLMARIGRCMFIKRWMGFVCGGWCSLCLCLINMPAGMFYDSSCGVFQCCSVLLMVFDVSFCACCCVVDCVGV